MITDVSEIRRLAVSKREENTDFRRYLRKHHCPEEPFHILAAEVERHIDCTQCANCCRELEVAVSGAEIAAIAAYLQMPVEEVERQYTTADPADSTHRVLRNVDRACVFLEGSLCMIYEARPRPCREFPHSELSRKTLGGRMSSQCRRAEVCPIVYNALEAYKHQLGYHPHA